MSDAPHNALLEPELLERVRGLTLVARRVVEGVLHGLHRAPQHGLSIEFVEHRQYTPGDELKRLDWRVLGRSDRYVIKQYEQETNMRVMLVVDGSRSMAYSGRDAGPARDPQTSKFHHARVLAASLGYLLLRQGDSVGLTLANHQVVAQAEPRATAGHLVSLARVLAEAEPTGDTDLARVLRDLAQRLKRRSLVVLVSDLLEDPDDVLAALGRLAHGGHEVLVFHVLDPRELDFELGLAGYGVTVIRDMETGGEFEAEPQLVRDLVRHEVRRFCAQLDDGARAHRVDLVRLRTDEPVARALTRYVQRRAARGTLR
jgi:uncharacterized protein (DUF58 family)